MIEFPFTLQNNDTTDVGLSLNGSAFVFTDDQTQGYELYYVNGTSPDACDKYTKLVDYHLNALGAQKNVELSIQARGQLPAQVKSFHLLVTKAGRIEGAQWNLPVPR